ncbi:hypothetical protein GCM10010919_32550 [Alishewanella longhuensis]|uniref:DUF1302 domain-containing protein n=1 Tax=Alishewanella longhuensis TaxID=1091037 RepID=A0ABQ3L250_9ALTE|nr:DUF1302 domain-containing protein [Alishewanella longhuensis]GHG77153.1 hypothetical protein GCM10010919_32550 [Alishewanella longhuensis]
MNKRPNRFAMSPLAAGVTAALLALAYAPAQAATFNFGDVEVVFDSTFSYGASWRTEERNWDTIAKVNHPRFDWTGYNAATNVIYPAADIWAQPGAYSSNGDAGNLNFDRGDMFSSLFKGLHEVSIKKDNIGFFGRFMYFYDTVMNDGKFAYTNPLSGNKVDPCEDKGSRELACKDLRLLDAYIYGNFSFNDGQNPVTVRLGNQVLSWGESTFIQHGINITPIDVGIARAPGAELKEAFIPTGMLTLSVGLTDNLSTELFYQYSWQESYLPPPGTYFSTNDFAGRGGYAQNIQLGFSGNPDIDLAFLLQNLNNLGSAVAAGQISPAQASQIYLAYPTKVALRPFGDSGEIKPKDSGQYGIKFEYFAPSLGDTEFAVYYMNYHSRVPVISGVASDFRTPAIQSDLGFLVQNAGNITKENVQSLRAFSKGLLEYPEDIKLYGASFNTNLGTTSVAGEFSFRQDEPLQIDDVEILYAGMPEQLAIAGIRPDLAGISQLGRFIGTKATPGNYAQGYILRNTVQAQMTFTHLFGPTLGADNFSMLAEVGGVRINNMPAHDVLRLNGPNTDRSGAPLVGANGPSDGLHTGLSNGAEQNPFPTASAWGYRILAKADYNNVFAGVNLSQRLVFSHDVNGITPDPLFMFVKDRKSASYAVSFDYLNKWSGELSYNWFWGGVGTTNNTADRDFVSFNIKYSI